MKTLLITGFEPFGSEKMNPSWEAVEVWMPRLHPASRRAARTAARMSRYRFMLQM